MTKLPVLILESGSWSAVSPPGWTPKISFSENNRARRIAVPQNGAGFVANIKRVIMKV